MKPEVSSASEGRWSDLGPRLVTGVILAIVSVVAFWVGGYLLIGFVGLIVALIVWELSRMLGSGSAVLLAGTAGVCCVAMTLLPVGLGLPLVMLPLIVGIGRVEKERLAFGLFATIIVLAGYGLIRLHDEFGLLWLLWLILVVGVTDVAGFFAGRAIGGPKFWPKVSPKKTWSGTVAGWIGAALVGLAFIVFEGADISVLGLSIALSMASQMGDIAESALKRRVGVKDSSNLLPGHGGFFDRFDGVLGASVMLLLVEQLVIFPPMGS